MSKWTRERITAAIQALPVPEFWPRTFMSLFTDRTCTWNMLLAVPGGARTGEYSGEAVEAIGRSWEDLRIPDTTLHLWVVSSESYREKGDADAKWWGQYKGAK